MHGAGLVHGLWLSIRNEGMTVGSDITTDTGSVGFRLMYGAYICIVEDRSHAMTSFQIRFDTMNNEIALNPE